MKQRIYLIDPVTNKYFDGLLNTPAIYLTHTPPIATVKRHRRMGFIPELPGESGEEVTLVPDDLKVDATLYFSYPDQSIFSGYDEKTGMTVMVIQVWHDEEIETWRKIAQRVAAKMVVVKRNQVIPTVAFYITSAILPFDPNESHQFVIPANSGCGECTNAISHKFVLPQDDDFEDE